MVIQRRKMARPTGEKDDKEEGDGKAEVGGGCKGEC